MSIWEALILGIVQGITEFLPVSSSGHLVLLQRIFGINEPSLVFETALHGGTLLAVIVVLWRDIWNILCRFFQPLTLYLVIATMPTVIAALLFKDQIDAAFATGAFLGYAFLVTSALLFFSEMLFRRSKKSGGLMAELEGPRAARGKDEINLVDALLIGLFQAIAIIPGISRSGATISAALSRRLDRDFAARFSFLLSIPAIAGALILHARELAEIGSGDGTGGTITLLPVAVGTISAAIVAFLSIRLIIKIIRERSLHGFAIYTGVLGLFVLIDKFGTRFFF